MSPIEIIIASVGSSAVLFGVLGYFAKSLVSQLLAKDIENHKSKIKFEIDLELTKFKSEIEKSAFEHQTRFSKLHDKRAEVIADLYSRIVDLYIHVNVFTKIEMPITEKNQKEKKRKLWGAVEHYRDYFFKHKIFLEQELCNKIEQLDSSMSLPISKLMMHIEKYGQNNDFAPVIEAWQQAQKTIDTSVKEIKQEIEDEFRVILGVIEKNDNI